MLTRIRLPNFIREQTGGYDSANTVNPTVRENLTPAP